MTHARAEPHFRIDPFDLRLFSAIVERGSITAGAKQIHLSLTAASVRLQNLEHAVGATLLLRSKGGVIVTDAGKTLLRHAGRIQGDIESLYADMARHTRGLTCTVRLLCNTSVMSEHLPTHLANFLVRHCNIDIDLRELDSNDVLQAMRQKNADIGIVADYVETQGLDTILYKNERLVALLPAKTTELACQEVSFANLLDLHFVGLPIESGLSRFLHTKAIQFGKHLHHRVRVRSLDSVVGFVGEGVGIAIVPEATAIRLANDHVRICPLTDSWANRRLLVCTSAEADLGSGAQLLLEFLKHSNAELCPSKPSTKPKDLRH